MDNLTGFVIEDDRNFSAALDEVLRRRGCEVRLARDGLTALELLKGPAPDFILLDIHLPYARGEEILAAMEKETRFKQTRIALMTADLPAAAELAPRADIVLEKPFVLSRLIDWLDTIAARGQE